MAQAEQETPDPFEIGWADDGIMPLATLWLWDRWMPVGVLTVLAGKRKGRALLSTRPGTESVDFPVQPGASELIDRTTQLRIPQVYQLQDDEIRR